MTALRKAAYPDCNATLTREEIAAQFALADPDLEPMEGPTRVPTTWRGPVWFERDLGTGRVTARGAIETLTRLTHSDREELRP